MVLYLYIGEYLYFGHGTKYVNKAGEDCIAGGGWSVRGHFHQPPHRCLSPLLPVCSLYFLYFAFHKVFSENPHVSKYAYEYKDT